MNLNGLDVKFVAATSENESCICDCCHNVGRVVKLEIPDTKFFNGKALETKYFNLWMCEKCRRKLTAALEGCDADG